MNKFISLISLLLIKFIVKLAMFILYLLCLQYYTLLWNSPLVCSSLFTIFALVRILVYVEFVRNIIMYLFYSCMNTNLRLFMNQFKFCLLYTSITMLASLTSHISNTNSHLSSELTCNTHNTVTTEYNGILQVSRITE